MHDLRRGTSFTEVGRTTNRRTFGVDHRPRVAFIAWTPNSGRALDIAGALRGEARTFFAFRIVNRHLVPLRYLVDSFRTAGYLALRRPRALIVTNPPPFAALVAYAYARLAGVPFILDSHPSSFALSGDGIWRLLLPLHARLASRAAATLVTTDELAAVVRQWDGHAQVVHEPPTPWRVPPAGLSRNRPRVLFTGNYNRDEPVMNVLEAGRALSGIDFHVTGDLRRCPSDLRKAASPNVRFVGYLARDQYRRALEEADVILTLTTQRNDVPRTAYEAVYANRPLVVPDRPLLRSLFPYAVHVPLTSDGIVAGLHEAIERHAELVAVAPKARVLQEERWRRQQASLEAIIAARPLPARDAPPTG